MIRCSVIFFTLLFQHLLLAEEMSYTIVTAFFNINRGQWNTYARPVDSYLYNGIRMLSLDDNMVIYIEPQYVDFVWAHREKYRNKTKVIPMKIEELACYKYKDQIQSIMEDPFFKQGLVDPVCPEVTKPLYDVIMWSKVPLVMKTIENNPFNSTHFVWLDFGIHIHMLKDEMLNKPLLTKVSDKMKFLCRSQPCCQDLDIVRFYKSHTNRFAGTMFTGSGANFRMFDKYLEEEIQDCLNKKVVDCDQSLFSVTYLKHPEIFELYNGDWGDILTNY